MRLNILTQIIDHSSRVSKAVDRAERRVLYRQGGYVRTTAVRSLKRRINTSSPGQTPSLHARGSNAYSTIKFRVDARDHTVTIGIMKFNVGRRAVTPLNMTLPELYEFGGLAEITEIAPRSMSDWARWKMANPTKPIPTDWLARRRQIKIEKRPTMRPALEKSAPKLTEFWRNSLGK